MTSTEKILSLIKNQNITEYLFEKTLNLANGSVQRWKNNKANPSAEAIVKIAQYFGITTDYLLGLTDSENQPMIKGGIYDSVGSERELLPPQEQELLFAFRKLKKADKEYIIKNMQVMYLGYSILDEYSSENNLA